MEYVTYIIMLISMGIMLGLCIYWHGKVQQLKRLNQHLWQQSMIIKRELDTVCDKYKRQAE
jgi:hypothetical protein